MKHITGYFTLFMLACFAVIIPSCKKSDPTPPDPAKILEGKNWKMVSITSDPAFNGITEVYDLTYDACEQDDIYQFKPGNAFALDNGATKCDATDPQSRPGSWSYDNNSKILQIIISYGSGSDVYDYTLTEINDDHFKTQIPIPGIGVNYTFTTTWQKQ